MTADELLKATEDLQDYLESYDSGMRRIDNQKLLRVFVWVSPNL